MPCNDDGDDDDDDDDDDDVLPCRYISAMYHAFSGLMAAEFGVGNTYYSCAGGFGDAVDVLPSFLPNINLIGFAVVGTLPLLLLTSQ
jgi:hypothetical protein